MIANQVKYSQFFGEPIPENPLKLLKNISKDELIATITAVNTRLKPVYNTVFDNTSKTQVDSLITVLYQADNKIINETAKSYIEKYLNLPKHKILFSRITCLFALQEILISNEFSNISNNDFEERKEIFKYLLICNERILAYDNSYSGNDHKKLGKKFFEYFMFKEIPQNQYNFVPHPLNRFYIGWYLMDKLTKDDLYSDYLVDYLENTFGISDITEFFKYLMSQFFGSNDDLLKVTYLRVKIEMVASINVLKKLSERDVVKTAPLNTLKYFDFIEIKKSPVYDGGEKNGIHTFFIMDSILFLEKIYGLFINDFWFDYLRPNKICNRKDWGNFLGSKFFEPFLDEIFTRVYSKNRKVTQLNGQSLTIKISKKKKIEIADYYLRSKNKIMLIQAKSNYLPIEDGFKTVRTIEDYNDLDLVKFYKNFGLEQLVEKTLKNLVNYKQYIKDPILQKKGKINVYPVLLLNEPIISLGFSVLAFRRKFDELLLTNGIDKDSVAFRILPLSILNISELQDIEQSLTDRDQCIFNLFQMHFSATNLENIRYSYEAATPLRVILNKHISSHKKISNKIRKFEWLGFYKNK